MISGGLSTMALQEKLSSDIGGLTKLRSMYQANCINNDTMEIGSLISLSYSDYLKFLRLESCDYKRFFFRLVDIAMLTLSKIRPSNGEYVLKLQYTLYNDGNKEDLEDVEVGDRSGGSNEDDHKYDDDAHTLYSNALRIIGSYDTDATLLSALLKFQDELQTVFRDGKQARLEVAQRKLVDARNSVSLASQTLYKCPSALSHVASLVPPTISSGLSTIISDYEVVSKLLG
ncbi:hypothetical protein KSS87_011562 [Heliosperma pusillum]|nr:hypothetical protein KSS87_011562 [Heliosperma pusillum]